MTKDQVRSGLATLHLPASWADWVEGIEIHPEENLEGPYDVHRPTPPERTYYDSDEDWDSYTEHVRSDIEMLEATLNYEMELHLWVELHGDKKESIQYVRGPSVFHATLTGTGRKLRLVTGKPDQGWMIASIEWKELMS